MARFCARQWATSWRFWSSTTPITQPICRQVCGINCHGQSAASSQLEGNTYSRQGTERLIEFGQAAEGKNALETQMILNHKQAIEYLVLDPAHAQLTPDCVIALHAFLSDGLMADPTAVGRLRRQTVEIGGSVYLPVAMPQRLEELFGINIQMAAEIDDPFEQALFLMVHVPYLQPFEDVN